MVLDLQACNNMLTHLFRVLAQEGCLSQVGQ